EAVAREGGFSRAAVDDVTLLRYRQYAAALADDRAFQRRTLQPVFLGEGKRRLVVDADEGVHATTAEGLAALAPTVEGGVVTYGSQTHPADGAAGCVVLDDDGARGLAEGRGVVRLLAAGFARAEKARMPKAATTAAVKALSDAGLAWSDVAIVNTHNPFAINDLWFAQQTRFALERMNPFGCSLVYGHPQAPTGMRGIVELVEALRLRGGGVGVFTGCAAGDTGAALVVRVE
ncbi:MAG TPA: thiolase family protein, partial [Caldimonas sp.]|nr:thiolase family protein [Caldimonas sp.]